MSPSMKCSFDLTLVPSGWSDAPPSSRKCIFSGQGMVFLTLRSLLFSMLIEAPEATVRSPWGLELDKIRLNIRINTGSWELFRKKRPAEFYVHNLWRKTDVVSKVHDGVQETLWILQRTNHNFTGCLSSDTTVFITGPHPAPCRVSHNSTTPDLFPTITWCS